MLGVQTFLRDKFAIFASNDKCMQEVWKNFEEVLYKGIERFVLHKLLSKNLTLNITTRKSTFILLVRLLRCVHLNYHGMKAPGHVCYSHLNAQYTHVYA